MGGIFALVRYSSTSVRMPPPHTHTLQPYKLIFAAPGNYLGLSSQFSGFVDTSRREREREENLTPWLKFHLQSLGSHPMKTAQFITAEH